MKKVVAVVCALMSSMLTRSSELAEQPSPSYMCVEMTARKAYNYAWRIRQQHAKHWGDGAECAKECRTRVITVAVNKEGKEQWKDVGSVVEASEELMLRIKLFSVIAPQCGVDPNHKPVPAILIRDH